jgi:pectinesterase
MNQNVTHRTMVNFLCAFCLAAVAQSTVSPCDGAEALVKTVKPDGSGQFTSIQAAIDSVPNRTSFPVIIEIAPGRYQGRVEIPKNKSFVTLRGMGDQPSEVWIGSALKTDERGVLSAQADDFRCEHLTIEYTGDTSADPQGGLYSDGKRQVMEDCDVKGWHNAVEVRNETYFHFCRIQGGSDIISGAGTAVFDACDIVSLRGNGGCIAAPRTPKNVEFGFVFLDCRLVKGNIAAASVSLMRPWGPDGHTAFVRCVMDDHIAPAGWAAWDGRENTCRAEEFGSVAPDGAAINLTARAPWLRRIPEQDASHLTIRNIFPGWDPHANIPGSTAAASAHPAR